jgi:catechol 2,3-dioxygenase-like lactoylglutathione lyase family enzyme
MGMMGQAEAAHPPPVGGLLETALYVADLNRSLAFYEGVLGLPVMLRNPRMAALDAGRQGVLLLFQQGSTSQDSVSERGTVPGHEGQGRLHMAFAIASDAVAPWRDHLARHGVPLAGEMHWPRGGLSLYVRDPDDHAVEFATPGLWPNY